MSQTIAELPTGEPAAEEVNADNFAPTEVSGPRRLSSLSTPRLEGLEEQEYQLGETDPSP